MCIRAIENFIHVCYMFWLSPHFHDFCSNYSHKPWLIFPPKFIFPYLKKNTKYTQHCQYAHECSAIHWSHILRENWLSLSKQPSIAKSSSSRLGTSGLPFVPCWYFVWLDCEMFLCMLSQSLWVNMCNCPLAPWKHWFVAIIQHLWLLKSPFPPFPNDSWAWAEGLWC